MKSQKPPPQLPSFPQNTTGHNSSDKQAVFGCVFLSVLAALALFGFYSIYDRIVLRPKRERAEEIRRKEEKAAEEVKRQEKLVEAALKKDRKEYDRLSGWDGAYDSMRRNGLQSTSPGPLEREWRERKTHRALEESGVPMTQEEKERLIRALK